MLSMFSTSATPSKEAPAAAAKANAINVKDEASKAKQADSSFSRAIVSLRGLRATQPNRSGKQKLLESQKYRLPIFYSGTTTVATTYTTVIPIVPSDSTEYSAIAALYDEIRVDSIDMILVLGPEVSYTTFIPALWGIAFDPLSSAALSSTTNIVQHSQHLLWGMGVNSQVTTPTAVAQNGLLHATFRVPPGEARSTASAAIFGHVFSSTSDTGDIYGYLKPYWKSLGATGTHGFEMIVTLNVTVRSRT